MADKQGGDTPESGHARSGGAAAIYHVMRSHETFDDTADRLLQLIRSAAEQRPSVSRHLFLDIEGHRNPAGGFDHDAYELQREFILGYLSDYLAEVSMPLGQYKNRRGQSDEVPEALMIVPGGYRNGREQRLRSTARDAGAPTYDSETGEYVHSDGTRTRRDGVRS